ncbi:MAG: WS/DGAT domain-containing protein, partial [Acidimicrobiales bacterium]
DMGNRISTMFVSLATTIEDPAERLATITQGTKGAKDQHHAIGAEMLTDWVEFAAPAVVARAARLYSRMRLADLHRPLFNVTISNVPGPHFPLYAFGTRLVANYPMGPIFDGSALNLTVMSYLDSMFFGLVACREAVDDVWLIARGIEQSLDELKKAAVSG